MTEIVIMPEKQITCDVINFGDIVGEWFPADYMGIEAGKTYEVTLDGVKYLLIAEDHSDKNYNTVTLGDYELVTKGNTSCNIPFGYAENIPLKDGDIPWDDYFPYDFVTSLHGDTHTLGIKEVIGTEEPEEPSETISTAKAYTLRKIFPPIMARALIGGDG